MSEIELHSGQPEDRLADNRAVITLAADECRQCDWVTSWAETEEEKIANYEAQTAHGRATGHRKYWHYTVQRGEARLFF